MAGLPTLQVLLDDGTGTFPYDITAKCRLAYDAKRGRQDELATPTPGELKLMVDNTDGRFTPGSTIIASPSPIKADRKIRIKVTANAVTVNRFTGYVQQWPVAWPNGSQTMSEVQIVATDAQARAERRVLLSIVEEEILLDNPGALYTLGEPSTATAANDTSGNSQPQLVKGLYGSSSFGSGTGPSTDGLSAWMAPTGAGNSGDIEAALPLVIVPFTLSVFYAGTDKPPIASGDIYNVATLYSVSGAGSFNGVSLGIDENGKVSAAGIFSAAAVTDGLVHHLAVTHTGTTATLYVDGVSQGSAAHALSAGVSSYLRLGLGATGSYSFGLSLAHAAVFTSALSAARVLAHATAGLTGFAGEAGTARLTRLAAYAGVPIGTLDPSLTNVPFVDFTDKTAAACMQEVVDAEMGSRYVDGSGNETFHNRQEVVLKTTPDITIDANQLAPDTSFITDMQGVINFFETTAQGTQVRQVVRNTTSEASHGRYSASQTYLVASDDEARDRASWIVFTRAEPIARVGQLAIDMLTLTAAQQAQFLAAETDTWIRIQNLPSQTPGGTTADLVIQGFQDVLSATNGDGTWVLTANVVSKAAVFPSVWILGDSTYGVLGSTTRLGV